MSATVKVCKLTGISALVLTACGSISLIKESTIRASLFDIENQDDEDQHREARDA